MNDSTSDDDDILIPPTPARVAARALALSVVTCRGFVESEGNEAQEFWTGVRNWVRSLRIEDEFELYERELLDTPMGALERQLQARATWLCEGLVVLAWALGRYHLPSYDSLVEGSDVANKLGFLRPRNETILAEASLRPVEELEEYRKAIFAVHWRLAEFSLTHKPMDFAVVAETAWFGPLSLSQAKLIDGDLAIDSLPIGAAAEPDLIRCATIVEQRHRAANWLAGYSEVYSDVDTST